MSSVTKGIRGVPERRQHAAQEVPDRADAGIFPTGVIPWLAAAGTLWAGVPPLWPGMGVDITWSSVLFALGVAFVALLVGRTAATFGLSDHAPARAKAAALLVLLVVVPVVFDPRSLNQFNLVKSTATLIGSLAIAGAWAVEMAAPGRSATWRHGLHWPVLALLLWTAVATATSVSPAMSFLGATSTDTNDGLLVTVGFAIIFFGVVQSVTVEQVKAVMSVLYLGAGGLVILYGVIQLHDRLSLGGQWDWVRAITGEGTQSFAGGRIYSTFGNPNHLGAFLAVLAPVGVVLFLLHKARSMRILIVAIMGALLLELLQTASRGALLAALGALALAGPLLWPEVRRRRTTSLPVMGAVVAAVAVAAIGLAAFPRFSEKLSSGMRPGSTLSLRAEIWKVGVAMANDRPLVGHGPDTWVDRAPKYRDPEAAKRLGQTYYTNGAHNLFVGQLAATGYPGLFLLVGLLGFATLRAVGAWRRLRAIESESEEDDKSHAHDARLCLVGVGAALVAFVVQGSFNVSQIGLTFVFWVLLGLLCVLSLGAGVPTTLRTSALVARPLVPTRLDTGTVPHASSPQRHRQRRDPSAGSDVATGAVTVVTCLGLGFGFSAAARPLRADHNAAASSYDLAVARGAAPEDAARLSRRAGTRLAKAIRINPWEASYLAHHGDRLLATSQSLPPGSPSQANALRLARREYERTLDLRPGSARFLARYAEILLRIHQIDPGNGETRAEAIRALRRAVDADPFSPRLRERLQQALNG